MTQIVEVATGPVGDYDPPVLSAAEQSKWDSLVARLGATAAATISEATIFDDLSPLYPSLVPRRAPPLNQGLWQRSTRPTTNQPFRATVEQFDEPAPPEGYREPDRSSFHDKTGMEDAQIERVLAGLRSI